MEWVESRRKREEVFFFYESRLIEFCDLEIFFRREAFAVMRSEID